MLGFQNPVCPSICPYPEKRNHPVFVNISPTLVIDTSMERSSRVLQHGNPKIWRKKIRKSLKFEFWLVTKSWNHLSFVNISPTFVIDTSTEKSSRVLHHGNPIFFFLSSKFEFWLVTKSWNHLSFINISPTLVIGTSWKGLHEYYTWKPKILIFLKVRNSNFDLCWRAEITLDSSISALHW